jgi:hypothetical protein
MKETAMRAIIGIVNIVIATSAIYLKLLNGKLHWILADLSNELMDANLDRTLFRKIVGINHDTFVVAIILALSATISLLLSLIMF